MKTGRSQNEQAIENIILNTLSYLKSLPQVPASGRRPHCSSASACRHPPWPQSRPCSCGTGT